MLGVCRGKVIDPASDSVRCGRRRPVTVILPGIQGEAGKRLPVSRSSPAHILHIDLSGRVKSNKALRDGRRSSACSKRS
jgi:hypothetical protein